MAVGSELRSRKSSSKKNRSAVSPSPSDRDSTANAATSPGYKRIGRKPSFGGIHHRKWFDEYNTAKAILTILAFCTRFYILGYPAEVVFDEVHFGKFASYYLERTYFFDLHPPFAKLLIAAVGKLVGYDGSFKFDNIGDSYISNHVPYIAYRSLSAILGAMTIPLIFDTLRHSGYSVWACAVGASLVLFDNAHICETRLILLDATLVWSIAASIYCYVRFSRCRNYPFTYRWWKWLLLTGVSLSCVISSKYVGVFTFAMIGAAVLIDLWNLLDYRAGLSLKEVTRHFAARFFGLIVVPLSIFLFWFWVHFTVLSRSGPGDAFMSPEFQETLGDNIMAREAKDVRYYDIVSMRNKETQMFLSSNENHYPLRYDDGRVSSQGQMVSCDVGTISMDNNLWQILPEIDFPENQRTGVPVVTGQKIRLLHLGSNSILLTHDVASPYYPTNEEFTTIPRDEAYGPRFNETLFELRPSAANTAPQQIVQTKATLYKVFHVDTKVVMWTHSDIALPAEWAGGDQYEINGSKNFGEKGNVWYFDEIIGLDDERAEYVPRAPRKMNFFKKYFELQLTMFSQNNALTSSHPYASEPLSWPFLVKGVSFWTNDQTRTQIYFLGNYLGWWFCAAMMSVYFGLVVADQLCQRRNFYPINSIARSKLYNSMGFFMIGWMCHYFPFFLMGRQKFLHHYLPAHMISCLVAAGVLDFVTGNFDDDAVVSRQKGAAGKRNLKVILASVFILVLIVSCYVHLMPLTYGWPSLTPEQIRLRQWMNVGLHYAK